MRLAVCSQAESLRGGRQFGQDVALSELPCSGLGGKPDVRTTIETSAFLVPTHTFTNFTSFTVSPQEASQRRRPASCAGDA